MRTSLQKAGQSDSQQRGSAVIELTLAISFIFLPMLAGLATVGMSLVMSQQVSNLNSNAGQMFSSGVDFSQATNVSLLQKISGSLNLMGGQGVIILSQIDGADTGPVCSRQIVIGNAALRSSSYAPSALVNAAFTDIMPLGPGQSAYLAETYFTNTQYTWAFASPNSSTGIYTKAIF